ncbi:P-loop NTPase fold protein [Paraburkholderia sp. DGU8]|uniref:KAP family P-loop NTPase fold protein n=1 Tax=Paraburkholderia sp. DGU8 TaxID=3161997 RepID=UPI003467B6A2
MSDPIASFPLSLSPEAIDVTSPFEGDKLGRKKLAERLTSYIDRLQNGAVLAIDAPWGEGKSWFGRHWAAHLKARDYRVATIDAFQQDFVEDPFLLIAAEIANLTSNDHGEALKHRAVAVMKARLPLGTKVLINLAGRIVLGAADISEDVQGAIEAAPEKSSDAAEEWVRQKLENHEAEKQSLTHFRQALADFAAKQEKPVIVFIDELDRCRPSFAVRLIERIKHFFDVPNLVFVLLMNREQLEKAICGVYGPDTDASAYLGKFLHLTWRLPGPTKRDMDRGTETRRVFVADTLRQYGFDNTQQGSLEAFIATFSEWAHVMDLSLRDIQRGCALFIMADTGWSGLISYLIALKLKRPAWFQQIRSGSATIHETLEKFLQEHIPPDSDARNSFPSAYFRTLFYLHLRHRITLSEQDAAFFRENSTMLFGAHARGPSGDPFARAAGMIDLPIEDH